MPDASAIIHAYTEDLGEIPDTVQCHVFGTKYISAGEQAGGTIPLGLALTTAWEQDVFYTMYTSPAQYRCIKEGPEIKRFTFAAYDVDYAIHATKPTLDDFAVFVRYCYVLTHTPNIVYQTRGGARIIYLIDPIDDAENFERHYRTLFSQLSTSFESMSNGQQHSYKMDGQATDWTRFSRCPWVCRENEYQPNGYDPPEYHYHIRQFHDRTIDLTRWHAPPPPPKRQPTHSKPFDRADPIICGKLRQMMEGNRNGTIFAAACRAIQNYDAASSERWLAVIRDKAHQLGLPEQEIERTIQSAQKTASKK